MTSLPIPTDNLYKFIALAGLSLSVFSATYPYKLINELSMKTIEVRGSIKYEEVQADILKGESSELETKITEAEKNIFYTKKNLNQIKELLKLHKIKVNDSRLLNVKSESGLEVLKELLKQIKLIVYFSSIGLIIGQFGMFYGFIFWYIKVQKPADKALKEQSKNSKKTDLPPLQISNQHLTV